MRYIRNNHGGELLLLQSGDSLDEIRPQYQSMVTPLLESVFADPRVYFDLSSAATPIRNLAEYLRRVIETNQWTLVMADSQMPGGKNEVGFRWYCEGLYPIIFSLPSVKCHDARLLPLYEYFGSANWGGFGSSGEVLPLDQYIPLHIYSEPDAHRFSSEARVFATTISGDFFVIDHPDAVSMISHEDGSLHRMDSFLHCCEWIFETMLGGSPPEYPYDLADGNGHQDERPFQLRVVRPDDE